MRTIAIVVCLLAGTTSVVASSIPRSPFPPLLGHRLRRLASLGGYVPRSPIPKIVFDTDMYTDFDDAGSLACLHALADAGECEMLATIANTPGCMSVAMCEIIEVLGTDPVKRPARKAKGRKAR